MHKCERFRISKVTRIPVVLAVVIISSAALLTFVAFSAEKTALKITELFTKEEKKQAGLSKLTESELEALNAAILRTYVQLNVRGSAGSSSGSSARSAARDEDIDFYDSAAKAVAYIAADKDLTIYLWSGKPCAYLDNEDIYGFNGKHLGWFRSGLVYDHDGYVVAAVKGAFRTSVEFAPFKSFKEFKPFKSLKELKPLKPLWSKDWSSTPAKMFFLNGAEK